VYKEEKKKKKKKTKKKKKVLLIGGCRDHFGGRWWSTCRCCSIFLTGTL
jgi:hypothetical protein